MRKKLFVLFVLVIMAAVVFVVPGPKVAHADSVTMKCTHYSSGCVICKHYNADGGYAGKTMEDC